MNKLGFTLIELLVVIGIISTLLTIGASALVSYYHIQTFNVGVADVVTTLQTAKSYAQSQVVKKCASGEFQGYKVSFTANTYALNEACETNSPSALETKTIHKDLTITPGSITFHALTGNADLTGAALFTVSGYGRDQTIVVNPAGNIYVCPLSPAPCQ